MGGVNHLSTDELLAHYHKINSRRKKYMLLSNASSDFAHRFAHYGRENHSALSTMQFTSPVDVAHFEQFVFVTRRSPLFAPYVTVAKRLPLLSYNVLHRIGSAITIRRKKFACLFILSLPCK